MWAGVDVGGRRKGFHAAVVDGERLVAGPSRHRSAAGVVEWLRRYEPRIVAVDSPRSPARDGLRSREDERRLAREVCGIRYTPDRTQLAGNAYYDWIVHGCELYAALRPGPWAVIECFPTASWTRWAGPRRARSRVAWSRQALVDLGLAGVPPRLGQDGRDAIAAAVTARCHEAGLTDSFGEIVVPCRPAG